MRLFLGMLTVTLCATAGFALAVNEFVTVLEQELLLQTMSRELDGLVSDYRQGVDITGSRGKTGVVFVQGDDEPKTVLPPVLSRLSQGQQHLKVRVGGKEYYAAMRRIPGAAIYLLVDVDPIDALEKRLAVIGWSTLTLTVLVALLISLACSFLILRPVRNLARRLSYIEPQTAQTPIAEDYHDSDMHEIAASFDGLVERFQRFVDRERAFTADAGHELRTPLSVALSTHELLLAADDLPPRVRERLLRSNAACHRMSRTITALLFLARDNRPGQSGCNARDIVRDLQPYYQRILDIRDSTLVLYVSDITVAAPPEALNTLLHNLVEHAISHTRNGVIELHIDARTICISYGDGHHLPSDLDDVFDREYQPESGGEFGLGLYLVGRICARLGWPVCGRTSVNGKPSIHIACGSPPA
jgi:signal transduction histidine kinase